MDGILVEDLVILFQIELSSQKRLTSAGIDHHFGRDINFLSAELSPHPDGLIVHEVYALHLHALVNIRTQALGMLQQQEVKFGSVHMIGMIPVNAFLTKFREVQGGFFPIEIAPGGAELFGETSLIHFVDKSKLAEDSHSGEDQRFADMR